jgi:hypothetical protein
MPKRTPRKCHFDFLLPEVGLQLPTSSRPPLRPMRAVQTCVAAAIVATATLVDGAAPTANYMSGKWCVLYMYCQSVWPMRLLQ